MFNWVSKQKGLAFLMVAIMMFSLLPSNINRADSAKDVSVTKTDVSNEVADNGITEGEDHSQTDVDIMQATGTVNITNLDIQVDGKSYQTIDQVQDGSTVYIGFDWSISNLNKTKEFAVDLSPKGMKLNSYALSDLYDTTATKVGKYKIEDGVMYIYIDDEFLTKSNIKGSANIKGTVSVEDKDNNDGKQIEFGLAGSNVNVLYDANKTESYLDTSKNAIGSVHYDSGLGKYVQSFSVNMTAKNDKVTLAGISDTPGSNLGAISNIKYNGTTYGSLTEAMNAIGSINKDATATITYDMVVNLGEDIYDKNYNPYVSANKNEIEVTFKSNKNNTKTSKGDANINVNKPSVTKNGSVDQESGKVTWTINIHPGGLKDATLSSIIDTLDTSTQSYTGSLNLNNLNASDFVKNADGSYTLQYTTDVLDSVKTSSSNTNIKNDFKVTFNDKYTYTATGSTTYKGDWSIDKQFVESKLIDGKMHLSWKVSFALPTGTGIQDFSLEDGTETYSGDEGTHTYDYSKVTFKNVTAGEEKVIINNGSVADNTIVDYATTNDKWFSIRLTDAYLQSHLGNTIEVTYDTIVQDTNMVSPYYNKAKGMFKQNGTETSDEDKDKWVNTNALTKEGEATENNEINYTISVDASKFALTTGNIILTDKFADGLQLKGTNATVKVLCVESPWYSYELTDLATTVTPSVAGTTATFTVPVTSQAISYAAGGKKLKYQITYTMEVSDPLALVKAGNKDYKNEVDGSFNGTPIGTDFSITNLKSKNVITKTSAYSETTAPFINYTLMVNSDALDLAEGDQLQVVDTISGNISYHAPSFKAFKFDKGSYVELTAADGWSYSMSSDKKSVTFKIPDATCVRIAYSVKTSAKTYVDSSKNETVNAENSVKLTSIDSSATKDTDKVYTVAFTPTVTAEGEDASVTVFKFHESGSSKVAVAGTKFKVVECSYDPVKDEMKEDKVVYSSLEVASEGEQKGYAMIDNLRFDQIYALYEIDADEEFTIRKDPAYFVFKGADEVELPESASKYTVEQIQTGTMDFKNTKRSKADYSVEKVWMDHNSSTRPASVQVRLLANGVALSDPSYTVELNSGNNWKHTWNDLYTQTQQGDPIVYSVEELNVPTDYTVSYDTTTKANTTIITNSTEQLTSYAVEKKWDDKDNQDGIRPDSVQIHLLQNGVDMGTEYVVTLSASNSWTYKWNNLPVYDSSDKEYVYSVKEEDITGYAPFYDTSVAGKTTVTNSHGADVVSVDVEKKWNDSDNQDGIRPESIEVQLYKKVGTGSKTKVGASVKLNKDNAWKTSFKDLPKYESGKIIVYTVDEVSVPTEYTKKIVPETASFTADTAKVSYVIENTHEITLTDYTVEKKWEDNGNQDGIRPASITVHLFADGVQLDPAYDAVLSKDNGWTYKWTALAAYAADNHKIKYSVKEDSITGYVGSYDTETSGKTVITNTHITDAVSVSVEKKWTDDNNQDGIRPEKVEVQLFKQVGTNAKTAVGVPVWLDSTNYWKHEWKNLSKYDGGKIIVYTVDEVTVPSGYTKTISPAVATFNADTTKVRYLIENKHTADVVSVKVNKKWENGENPNPPASISVYLMADGVKVAGSEQTLTAPDWTYTWTDLPKTASGKEIVYSVGESVIKDYTSKGGAVTNGVATLTNTYTPGKKSVKVTKVWEDNGNQDGIRPETLTMELWKDNGVITEYVESVTLPYEGKWEYTWDDLDENFTYYVSEPETIKGYSANKTGRVKEQDGMVEFVNTHVPEVTQITVDKKWVLNDENVAHPSSVQVMLYANGSPKSEPVELSDSNTWTHTWTDLPVYENGIKNTYSVLEVVVPDGYSAKYSELKDGKITVTNTYPSTSRTVKKVWSDMDNQDGIRPDSIKVTLYKSEKGKKSKVETVTLDETNAWTYTWMYLQKCITNSNEEIVYSIEENSDVDGYTSQVTYTDANGKKISPTSKDPGETGMTVITNKHSTKNTSISVEKKWVDDNNRDGIRPNKITVSLYADNKKVSGKSVTLSESNNWSAKFTNLPMYKDGKEIEYSVVESKVDHYTVSYSEIKNGKITITNTYKPGKTSLTVKKVWRDGSDQDGIRPGKVKVQLYADGKKKGLPKTLSKSNGWTYTWENLDKKKDGKKITYTVSEISNVEGYETTVNTDDKTDVVTITNKHTPAVRSLSVHKQWNDGNNADGIRPSFVVVQLYANGEKYGEKQVLDENNAWSYEWINLPVYEDGEPITYKVKERKVKEYEVTYSDIVEDVITITNSYTPNKTSFGVSKVWDDQDNKDRIRPNSIKVQLYADGVAFGEPIVLSDANGWGCKWTQLPLSRDGKEIVYSVEEIEIPDGYVATKEQLEDGEVVIKNTHKITTSSKKTGDASPLRVAVVLFLISLLGLSAIAVMKRKEEK